MPAISLPKLFRPLRIGDIALKHRVVLAPCTRLRNTKQNVPLDYVSNYYAQRSSTPGTLLISEATLIHRKAGGLEYAPALETGGQLAAWKKVTDAVHAKGSYIFSQLWAFGRAADPAVLAQDGYPYIAPSKIGLPDKPELPRSMTISEIKEFVGLYTQAAGNAVHRAGFDGVELHAANGYLIDQFLQDNSNHRTDEYGGSVENRTRFALDVINSVVNVVGAKKVGIRLSPWSEFQDMRMKDPKPTFSYLVQQIAARYSDLAYIHLVEPRMFMPQDVRPDLAEYENNDFIRNIWGARPLITCGGHNRESALRAAEIPETLVAFGRPFIANPDLPLRLLANAPLNTWDRSTFYTPERKEGYLDYPFAEGLDASLLEKAQSGMF